MKKTAAVLCAALLALGACGNADNDKAVKNISAELEGEKSEGGATKEEADCVAEGMVDDIGVEKLQEYGLLTKDLKVNTENEDSDMDKDDAESFAATYVDCIDLNQAVLDDAAQQAGGELTDEQKSCVEDAIDEKVFEAGFAASLQGEEDKEYTAQQTKVQECVAPADGEDEMQLPEE